MNRLIRLANRFNSPKSKCQFASASFGLRRGLRTQNLQRRKILLPKELLSKNVSMLTCESLAKGGICHVYLLGTRHDSLESCQEVQGVISYLKPEVVFLELCKYRKELLKVGVRENDYNYEPLSMFALKKAAPHLVNNDSEFHVAYEEAMKYGGKVILGDLPEEITFERILRKMSLWEKIKAPFYFIWKNAILRKNLVLKMRLGNMTFWERIMPSSFILLKGLGDREFCNKIVEVMKSDDFWDHMERKFYKWFPTAEETLVHERDLFMSCALLKIASKHSSIVAVVGKNHLQGIKKHWKQPVVVKDLLEILELEIQSQIATGFSTCKDA